MTMLTRIFPTIQILSALVYGGSSAIAFGQAAVASNGGVPVVTVCEALHDLSRYNGMDVIVIGRFGGTNEGSWLSEDCERKIVTDGYTWANIISTSYSRSEVQPPPILPTAFRWQRTPSDQAQRNPADYETPGSEKVPLQRQVGCDSWSFRDPPTASRFDGRRWEDGLWVRAWKRSARPTDLW
jgi:hypothetical protein